MLIKLVYHNLSCDYFTDGLKVSLFWTHIYIKNRKPVLHNKNEKVSDILENSNGRELTFENDVTSTPYFWTKKKIMNGLLLDSLLWKTQEWILTMDKKAIINESDLTKNMKTKNLAWIGF
jgi:hypothetical protein